MTRRLVEVNLEQLEAGQRPRLDDLAFRLVTEDLAEAIGASRRQMSRLLLSSGWAAIFDDMRSASISFHRGPAPPSDMNKTMEDIDGVHSANISLRRGSPSQSDLYQIIENISAIRPPKMSEHDEDQPSAVQDDEDTARRIVSSLSAFAYFGMAVVDAFADEHFSLYEVMRRTKLDDEASYQQLAAARLELSISPASARLILHRFHDSLKSRYDGKLLND